MYIDIDAAKHAARRLRNLAKSSSSPMALNAAQRLVAIAAGHKDWHALEQAIAEARPIDGADIHAVVHRLQDGGYRTEDPDGPMDVFDVAETLLPDEPIGSDDHLAIMADVPDSAFLPSVAPDAGDEPGRARSRHRRVHLEGITVRDPGDDAHGDEGDAKGDDQPLLWTITASVGDASNPDAVAQAQLVMSYGHDVRELAEALDRAGGGGAALLALAGDSESLWAHMLIVTGVETRQECRGRGLGTLAVRTLAAAAGHIRRFIKIDSVNVVLSVSDLPLPIADHAVRDAAHAWIGRPAVREALYEELRHPLPFHVVAGAKDERYRMKAPRSSSIRAVARRRAGTDAPIVDWPAGCDARGPLTQPFHPDADLLAWLPGHYVAAHFTTAPTDWLARGARSTVGELVLIDRDGGRTTVTQADIEAAVEREPDPADPLSVTLRNLAVAYRHVSDPLSVDDVGSYVLKRSSRMATTTATFGGIDAEKLRNALQRILPSASSQERQLRMAVIAAESHGGYAAYSETARRIVDAAEADAISAIGELVGADTPAIAADQTLAREVVHYRRATVRLANEIGSDLFERCEAEAARRTAITPGGRDVLARLASGGRVLGRMSDDGERISWHAGAYDNEELCGMDDGLRLVRLGHVTLESMKLTLTWSGLDAARALGVKIGEYYQRQIVGRREKDPPMVADDLPPVETWREFSCEQRLAVTPVPPKYHGDPTTHVAFTVSSNGFEMTVNLAVTTVRTMDGFLAEAGKKEGPPLVARMEGGTILTVGDAGRPASIRFQSGCDRVDVELATPLHRMLRKLLKEAVRPGAREAVFEPVAVNWTSMEEPE